MTKSRYRPGKLKLTDKILLGTAAAWLTLVAATAVNAKGQFAGSMESTGEVIEEMRQLDEFHEITVVGSVNVEYTPGPRSECRLIAESSVMPKLQTSVGGKALEIRLNGNIFTDHTAKAVCTSPALQAFYSKGTSRSVLTDITAKRLSLTVQGTGDIDVTGEAGQVNATVQGTGNLRLDDLVIEQAELLIQGTGSIHANQAAQVNASIAGTGNIYISRDARVGEQNLRGVGRLRRN